MNIAASHRAVNRKVRRNGADRAKLIAPMLRRSLSRPRIAPSVQRRFDHRL
jgi:hypothetical protein